MKCVVLGAGYVGVATGLALVERGHHVELVDVLPKKVAALRRAEVPFHEPGVPEALRAALAKKLLRVSADLVAASREANAIFICVGTPPKANGSADLGFVKNASKQIGVAIRETASHPLVVLKSTAPPGTTTGVVRPLVEKASGLTEGRDFFVLSNPEFLREGSALADAKDPDRIVIGGTNPEALERLVDLWKPGASVPVVKTSPVAAETIKYASNAFLAMKVSFANEIANLCTRLGVDVYDVMHGVGLDARIGRLFLRAGAGFGGSCFPKDVRALEVFARAQGVALRLPRATLEVNESQPLEVLRLLEEALGSVRGKRVALLGLAFKPDTDDVRETRALPILRALEQAGARVVCWDPKAVESFRRLAGTDLDATGDMEVALRGSDAPVIQTEWPELRQLAPSRWRSLMKGRIVVDGRRAVDPTAFETAGLAYFAIGYPVPQAGTKRPRKKKAAASPD